MVDGTRLDFWEAILTFYISECKGDFDQDNDVDGSDLAQLAADPGLLDLSLFAADFGKTNCPISE